MELTRNKKCFPRNNVTAILQNINVLYKFDVIDKEKKHKLVELTKRGVLTSDFTELNTEFLNLHKTEICLTDVILECAELSSMEEI